MKGKAAPFSASERRVAETLRIALLEVVLRLADVAGEERQRAHEQQQLLIAELNHRVRNILALIRGLIAQSQSGLDGEASVAARGFVSTLDERVQALARAHDQITADRWGPARLIDLIETEAAAYLGDRFDRVRLSGANVLLDPTAFTVLALVFHELLTNAAKYGALSDSGAIAIAWRVDADGSLLIDWRESGGPAVTAPTRRGFGSTIIERSVPFELGGRAEIRYRLAGLEADFCIPSRFVASTLPDEARAKPTPAAVSRRPLDRKTVLLVEDSMIIALDAEDALRALGAQEVQVAASTQQARALAAQTRFDAAVLDFNLGAETSLALADELAAAGVQVVFATGYGDGIDLPERFDGVCVVKKPYNAEDLAAALA